MANLKLQNLPSEFLRTSRFFPVALTDDGKKIPKISGWQKPENQLPLQQVNAAQVGFDTCGHDVGDDFLFFDFDHVLNDQGEFVNDKARDCFNAIQQKLGGYAERSISGTGTHIFAKPSPGKFDTISNGKGGVLYFDCEADVKLEVFYKSAGRYCLVTGELFQTDSRDIASGAVVDEVLADILAAIQRQNGDDKKSARQEKVPQQVLHIDTLEYDQFRARRMLDCIVPADLEDSDWLAVMSACKNIGIDYSVVDSWNQRDPDRYDENENLKRWDSLNNPSYDIETLHGKAKEFGYSERDAQREWYQLHPELSQKKITPSAQIDDAAARCGVDPAQFVHGLTDDLDNGRRLAKFCGDRVKWLTDEERWLVWQVGGVWTRGSEKHACFAPEIAAFADMMMSYARKLPADAKQKKKATTLAHLFRKNQKISPAVAMMKSCDSIRITAADLDNHVELLNCRNGVVDLQTGKLYPADPALLLTQQCAADFDGKADSAVVEKFLREIMPDDETRAGLLRWLGYCLTGETAEEKFLIWTGGGGNGKGVLGGTVLVLAGDYAVGLPPRALLRNSRSFDANSATTALNGLIGTRFAISEELPSDGELDIALVKNLTGGDRIPLRKNYGEYQTLINCAKINISGNYTPKLENPDDLGLLRRMLNMPFSVRFGTDEHPADPALKRRLILPENLRGLLRLLVGEAVAWYRGEGLIISDIMKQATAEHLRQNDFIADFIEDNYVFDPNGEVKARDFIDSLKTAYPHECSRFKRADLRRLVAGNDERITYCEGRGHTRIFKGIKKLDAE